jgi:Na+/serine symporter
VEHIIFLCGFYTFCFSPFRHEAFLCILFNKELIIIYQSNIEVNMPYLKKNYLPLIFSVFVQEKSRIIVQFTPLQAIKIPVNINYHRLEVS